MEKRDEELELGEGQFSDDDDESRIEELERRLDELESTAPVSVTALGYAMGRSLAMVLSWSRKRKHAALPASWPMQLGICDLFRREALARKLPVRLSHSALAVGCGLLPVCFNGSNKCAGEN